MVHGSIINRSQRVIQLLEGKSTFIINVRAIDVDTALKKVYDGRDSYKDANLLFQKTELIKYVDKLKRTVGQTIDRIHDIITHDYEIRNANGDTAGYIEITPGDFVFFGCGRT